MTQCGRAKTRECVEQGQDASVAPAGGGTSEREAAVNETPRTPHAALPHSVHLVGIGGMALSGIAQVLLAQGVHVSGSDQTRSPLTEKLAALGADVRYGHAAEHIGGVDLVVATAAAKPDKPELREAARRSIPVISRAAMIARLMAGRIGIAVAGTHGKTTTATMVAWLLRQAGREPTFLLGGESVDLGTNAAPGTGPEIVVEADEYAHAFLEYRPQVAVVTNVEADHLEYFGSVAAYEDAFRQFMRRVTPAGVIIACADSPRLATLAAEGYPGPVETYGVVGEDGPLPSPGPTWLALDRGPGPLGGHSFSVRRYGEPFGRFALRLPGRHNVANALGAIAAGAAVDVDVESMRAALAEFRGARRRFELLGEAGGVTVIDDFAHHPTEIRATLQAARERFPGRRLVAIFQPHTYSRTAYLLEEFRECFTVAGHLYLMETYAAREEPSAGVGAQYLAGAVTRPPCDYVRSPEDAAERLRRELKSGDVLLTIGAGDIDRAGRVVLEGLRAP